MHIGSRLVHTPEELHRFVAVDMGDAALAVELKDAAAGIWDRCHGAGLRLGGASAVKQWTYLRIGEVGACALLLAAVRYQARLAPTRSCAEPRMGAHPVRPATGWASASRRRNRYWFRCPADRGTGGGLRQFDRRHRAAMAGEDRQADSLLGRCPPVIQRSGAGGGTGRPGDLGPPRKSPDG